MKRTMIAILLVVAVVLTAAMVADLASGDSRPFAYCTEQAVFDGCYSARDLADGNRYD